MKKILFLSIVFLYSYSTLFSQAAVEINIFVIEGLVGPKTQELTIGIDPAATVAFDRNLDEYGPPPSPGGSSEFEAMLYMTPNMDSDRLIKDIRGPALSPFTGAFSYNLFARPSPDYNSVTLNINLPEGVSGGNISDLVNEILIYPGENSVSINVPPVTGSMLNIILNFENITGVEEKKDLSAIPDEFELFQNYPNPFNPTTTIKYTIPPARTGLDYSDSRLYKVTERTSLDHRDSRFYKVGASRDMSLQPILVQLIVYDILGHEITTLLNDYQNPGSHQIIFNAEDLPSGVYLYRLGMDGFIQTKRMILLK